MELGAMFNLNDEEASELAGYLANAFAEAPMATEFDDGYLAWWEKVVRLSQVVGAAGAINQCLCPKRPVEFVRPEAVRMEIYDSFAGRIPVIYLPEVADFEHVVTNVIHKGVPPANLSRTGASFAFGKTTRFILLSAKPYSNVTAAEMGLSDEDWAEKSLVLRREHECTHYFTKRVFGISRLNLHDELIADFFGIYEAFGFYRAKWFQRFMGTSGEPDGRLPAYTEGLGENVCAAIAEVAVRASNRLEEFSQTDEFAQMIREERIVHLCRWGLADMSGLA